MNSWAHEQMGCQKNVKKLARKLKWLEKVFFVFTAHKLSCTQCSNNCEKVKEFLNEFLESARLLNLISCRSQTRRLMNTTRRWLNSDEYFTSNMLRVQRLVKCNLSAWGRPWDGKTFYVEIFNPQEIFRFVADPWQQHFSLAEKISLMFTAATYSLHQPSLCATINFNLQFNLQNTWKISLFIRLKFMVVNNFQFNVLLQLLIVKSFALSTFVGIRL